MPARTDGLVGRRAEQALLRIQRHGAKARVAPAVLHTLLAYGLVYVVYAGGAHPHLTDKGRRYLAVNRI